jgi:AcrR family transcriptional regulator
LSLHDLASIAEPAEFAPSRQSYSRLKPGPGKAADEVKADQRRRIHRAMVQLVADSGYEKVTVRKLTRLAGVSPSAFYVQFDGKEECFVSTYSMVMADVRRHIASTRRASRDREEQLTGALKGLMEGLTADLSATRLALVEAFAGGPAAIRRIRAAEATIEAAVRECLDRRDARVSPVAVSWIIAGTMRVARAETLVGGPVLADSPGSLVRWGLAYLDEEAPDFSRRRTAVRAVSRPSESAVNDHLEHVPAAAEDRELILATTLRLARADGYWRLSTAEIRRAAGLSAARFNREFKDVESCYLAAMRHLARHYFSAPATDTAPGTDWIANIHANISRLCRTIAADPDLAKLLFVGILHPGVAGMRSRETLVTELAESSLRLAPEEQRPERIVAEATIAALWSVLAVELESGRGGSIHGEASTYTLLVLAPLIGVDAAAVALERESQREG